MSVRIEDIVNKASLQKEDIVRLLRSKAEEARVIYEKAGQVKEEYVGKKTYFRGLLEFSNICAKNCFYCGIRRQNGNTVRYFMTDNEILEQVKYAIDNRFASVVLQSGERTDRRFTTRVTSLLEKISALAEGKEIGVTLSMGEQSRETFEEWFRAGANRYLIRIEASNKELYEKLHPSDAVHDYDKRLQAVKLLQDIGYQTGTGVMIGLPFQTYEDLADDLLFMKKHDIDMVGMGPYIEHKDTPLYKYRHLLPSKRERFELSLKMVAILRIMMKDLNIAATTAMQTLDPVGREKALKVGANVIMPNLTPVKYREGYLLYEDKPCLDEEVEECRSCLEARIAMAGDEIGYDELGTSRHYHQRMNKKN
ncbi:MAG: [FeFe] hydrogenase H-cluster radical SAM maturase HydE [Bacteroidales bacterium]|nr:[FeFe] hydrogenase H-cluster radical SAM maturase HydE [Bacteroidales bacterium]MCF8333629.1 [FeFe] hydrogenase H-cluster radical SAM maturase HydE [Bacteroidales bacterium]